MADASPLLVKLLADDIRAAAARDILPPAALAEALILRGWRPEADDRLQTEAPRCGRLGCTRRENHSHPAPETCPRCRGVGEHYSVWNGETRGRMRCPLAPPKAADGG